MIYFFQNFQSIVFTVQSSTPLTSDDKNKLIWLFGEAKLIEQDLIKGYFVGPKTSMVSPWSTNAVEITQNMAIKNILRIELFMTVSRDFTDYDPMLQHKYSNLGQDVFDVHNIPKPIIQVHDISEYNKKEGLALSREEVQYLEELSERLGRYLTDSEVFGFSQVNSEHCRHKIFNGRFIIDGQEQEHSLFQLIKKTTSTHPNYVISAYKDNVAFIQGPEVEQLSPKNPDSPDSYSISRFESVISIKAETHNFPTTVEPFNGAATGSGGEIRDRMAGGKGSVPLAGTAVYMTSYPRLEPGRPWEEFLPERKWLYQTPLDILIKASNGASDFGNKFGQPLISGSLFTFEYSHDESIVGFDKVIMLAGGIGYGKKSQSIKETPSPGDRIVVMGGDNYRIGMGGASVSSADTGEMESAIELNAVQRSNPEMQKRVANTIRAMVESDRNPIISIHDHGAGGHLNCLSELVENSGGIIDLDKLPVGDPTLSAKETIGNESQERMGLIIAEKDMEYLRRVASRERAPIYDVGVVTGDKRFTFFSSETGEKPMDLHLSDIFGSSPTTIMEDHTNTVKYKDPVYDQDKVLDYLHKVLSLEAVACKDWLTNKVDRCVGGLVAVQQCSGALQLPLNNCGVMALDYTGQKGIATSIGHAPLISLIDPVAGARMAIAEALTNIIWAPLEEGLRSVSLSANWMWPCRNEGEDARLYKAVKAASEFAIELGINIPTGKDSLSMTQKYPDQTVLAPGTLIVSAVGQCADIRKVIEPAIHPDGGSLFYISLSGHESRLGGSSFAQTLNAIGSEAPTISDSSHFKNVFNTIQKAIKRNIIQAGHDISSGGLITAMLEMCFSVPGTGMDIDLTSALEPDLIALLFSENSGILLQAEDNEIVSLLEGNKISYLKLGTVTGEELLMIHHNNAIQKWDIPALREIWYKPSYLFDRQQSGHVKARERYDHYKKQPLHYRFPGHFDGKIPGIVEGTHRIKAAILREKGSNSERELANALYRAGFEVRDIHMTDLIAGRETLEDIRFLGAVGGFSNSDVLGSAKGWAGAFKYNPKANRALERFFERTDTLSVGVCNGCQLFIELGLIYPHLEKQPKMLHNESGKHESIFTSVEVQNSPSIMFSSLQGCRLGVWVSHGEGKFSLPGNEDNYHIAAKYGYDAYPANPNGSDYNAAMITSEDGRHLVMMPHIERSFYPWNWALYPKNRNDEVSPWAEAFVNARKWLEIT